MKQTSHLWVVEEAPSRGELNEEEHVGGLFALRWWSRCSPQWKRAILSLGLVSLFVATGTLYGFYGATNSSKTSISGKTSYASGELSNESAAGVDDQGDGNEIRVDVHGAVRHPGVVTVGPNARVAQAIQAAGGFIDPADADNVNSAAIVWDGEEIDIAGSAGMDKPADTMTNVSAKVKTSQEGKGTTTRTSTDGQSRVNLNSADVNALQLVPGIGPKRAQEIVAYRQAHGAFTSVDGLEQVKGIGAKRLAKWKPYLYVQAASVHTKTLVS